jgi:hypothetical protein
MSAMPRRSIGVPITTASTGAALMTVSSSRIWASE